MQYLVSWVMKEEGLQITTDEFIVSTGLTDFISEVA